VGGLKRAIGAKRKPGAKEKAEESRKRGNKEEGKRSARADEVWVERRTKTDSEVRSPRLEKGQREGVQEDRYRLTVQVREKAGGESRPFERSVVRKKLTDGYYDALLGERAAQESAHGLVRRRKRGKKRSRVRAGNLQTRSGSWNPRPARVAGGRRVKK